MYAPLRRDRHTRTRARSSQIIYVTRLFFRFRDLFGARVLLGLLTSLHRAASSQCAIQSVLCEHHVARTERVLKKEKSSSLLLDLVLV